MAEVEGYSNYSTSTVNCVFNGFLAYTAIMLNTVTILALRKTASLPKPLKILLLSLAISDLGVGLLVQPLNIALLIIVMNTGYIENSNDTERAFTVIGSLLFYTSFLGVTALSADRFLALHLHLRYQELGTQKRVVSVVISIWVLSALLSLTSLRWIYANVSIFAIIGFACLITTALFYLKIYSVLRRHTLQIHALLVVQVGPVTQNNAMAGTVRLRKFTVGPLYVYLVFLVCYLPFICITVASIASRPSVLMVHLSRYASTLVFLNSSLNPLIYCWKMKHIRHAIRDMLRNIYPNNN